MTVVIVAAVLAMLKKHILNGLEAWKASLPAVAHPFVDQMAVFLGDLIDKIDVATLAGNLPGQLLTLIREGKGPSASSGVDLA